VSVDATSAPERASTEAAELACASAPAPADIQLEDKDFTARFSNGLWTVSWKWVEGAPHLANRVPQYRVPPDAKAEFDAEVQDWIARGWLQPFDGECDGLIPLMAVVQVNKAKVRPVMDYRELNQHVSSHTADGVVCGAKLRAWRRLGENASIIDLRKAYLQLRVDPSLWRYQVVQFKGRRYCLTRLGFGLNVAPKIMTAIVNTVLSVEADVRASTDSYIDDIIVDNSRVANDRVLRLLARFGLEAKPPESLVGARVLGLRVYRDEDGDVRWKRDNVLTELDARMSRRQLFSWCGQLVGHFPVAGWLRVACSFLKREASGVDWDCVVGDSVMERAQEINRRLHQRDPVSGHWLVDDVPACRVWCDASGLAIGACVEVDGVVVEDASWLRKQDDAAHINLAELEAVIKGLNLVISWGFRQVEVMTDSASVHGWLRSLIVGDRPVRVKGLGEALARRRLSLIRDVASECGLSLSVSLVASQANKADELTRVPLQWLRPRSHCATAVPASDVDIAALHDRHHFGVDRTLYLARLCHPGRNVQRQAVEQIVGSCIRCRAIDPAPVQWQPGSLEVEQNWWRVSVDVTHYQGCLYLTMVDSGPSRFALWRRLPDERAVSVVRVLTEVFRERGPPWQLLLDNSATFHSAEVTSACKDWGVQLLFRCAHRPSGNGIVERNHRTIKRMAARSGRDILDMVFWYNMAPKDGTKADSVPSRMTFCYDWKPPSACLPDPQEADALPHGREVFVKPSAATRCTSEWQRGRVTGPTRGVAVEVDGVPRHVADVRPVPGTQPQPPGGEAAEHASPQTRAGWRSLRTRRQPDLYEPR
jgi:transposase InsO family protein